MLGENARTVGVSFAIHIAVAAALFVLAGERILREPEIEYIEFEVAEPEPEREVKPAPAPPPPPPPPIPTEKRPDVVPETARVTRVDRSRPFQQDAVDESGSRTAPENTEAVPAATAPLSFAMSTTVGGGSDLSYTSDAAGSDGVEVGAPGPAGGSSGPLANQGARDVEVARDWQITKEPDAINDRDFEPDYPALAKREGREAVVVVRLDIDSTGRVAAATVIDGPRGHGFRKSALAYARELRFRPAKAGTNPVASRIEWTVRFYVRN